MVVKRDYSYIKQQTASEFLRIVNLNFQERHLDFQQESITSNIFAILVANKS